MKVPGSEHRFIANAKESLPLCAVALREQDGDTSLRAACLDVKHRLMCHDFDGARALALEQLLNHPTSAYLCVLICDDL